MTEDYQEEAQAFRDALRQAGANEEFEALDPATVKPSRSASRFNWPAVSAVAVVVVMVGLVGVLGTLAGRSGMSGAVPAAAEASVDTQADESGSAAAEAPADAQADEPGSAAAEPMSGAGGYANPEAAPAPEASSSDVPRASKDGDAARQKLGEPMTGFRWEIFDKVAVQAPEAWGYGMIPTSAWCISKDWPTAPYVSLQADPEVVPAIGCDGTVPADKLVWHLRLTDASTSLGLQELPSPWRYDAVEVDGVLVAVASDGSDPALVAQILDSARVLS